MTERGQWRGSAIAGAIVIATAIGFGMIGALKACAPPPGIDPVIGFELARVPAQVGAMLGDATCRAGQSSALALDTFVFIPAYAIFLGLAALAAGGRFAKAALAIVLVAALLDQVEGLTLWRILGAFPGEPSHFTVLVPAVRAKFALLGLAALLIGGRIVQRRGLGMAAGAVIVAGGALASVSVLDDARAPTMVMGAAVAWLALLLYAAIMSFIPPRAATP